MEIISSPRVDETFVTRFMRTSPSGIVDTGLAVIGPAEVTPWALLNESTKGSDEKGA